MSTDSHRIRLAGADVEFACAPGDTLLRAAQRAGLGFPYECNVGSCGNCKFELVDGEVANARQRHLGCQSQPQGDCVVKLRTMARYVPPHRRASAPSVNRLKPSR